MKKKECFKIQRDYNSICLSSGIGVTYFISEENLFIHLYGFLLVTKAGRGERGKHKTSKSFLFFLLLICIMLQVFLGGDTEGWDNPLFYQRTSRRLFFFFFFLNVCQHGASLVAQMVKKPPAKQETWVQCLSQEGPLEKGMGTHSSILAWESHGQKSLVGYIVHGVIKSWTWLSD